jgi:hypothetical protein
MKINRDEAVAILLKTHCEFRHCWEEHLEFWEGDEPGITNDFSVYIGYVLGLIEQRNESELIVACGLIERFIIEGDENVKYGATIGFLEGITNSLSHKTDSNTVWFNKFLQPKSREFCVELDKFWGTNRLNL